MTNGEVLWESSGYTGIFGAKIPGSHYVLENNALIVYSGIFVQKVQVVPLHTIEGMESESNFLENIFRCGKVRIYVRGKRNLNLILRVKYPNEVLATLSNRQIKEKEEYMKKRNMRKKARNINDNSKNTV